MEGKQSKEARQAREANEAILLAGLARLAFDMGETENGIALAKQARAFWFLAFF